MSDQQPPPEERDPNAVSDPADAAASLIVFQRIVDQERTPDLDAVQSVWLKNGPRAYKVAKFTKIIDRNTGVFHHYGLTIETWRKKQGRLLLDNERTISLSTEDTDEIGTLRDFLNAVVQTTLPREDGAFLALKLPMDADEREAIQNLVENLNKPQQVEVLCELLEQVGKDKRLLPELIERVKEQPKLFEEIAALQRLQAFKVAIKKLEDIVRSTKPVREGEIQELITENPWMFGSEYSELLSRRAWTRDEKLDFMMRKTTDGYIEVIEIKTPLSGAALFIEDKSHNTYYASSELSKAIGQVEKYIEQLDAKRDAIKANDGEDTSKIRAKIIIGCDGDENQKQALRRFNGHLHRIEIITFDQLIRIARNVIKYLEETFAPSEGSGESSETA